MPKPENACSCTRCKAMCCRPCWGTPEDIKAIIKAGYGHRLMLDYYLATGPEPFGNGLKKDIYVLSPAVGGCEGRSARFVVGAWGDKCTFQNKKNLCELHDKELKPTEGCKATHGEGCTVAGQELHKKIALSWRTDAAKKLVAVWKKRYEDKRLPAILCS
jgi:Fe-S-cluster containining protein